MIRTKKELHEYLEADKARYVHKPRWWTRFTYSETWMLYSYFRTIRYLEYYENNRHWYNLIPYLYCRLKQRKMALKYNIQVKSECIGPGFRYMHPGYLRITPGARIGKNATIVPNVMLGKRRPDKPGDILIGDNVYISSGAIILAPVTIGNNVTIAANSVVVDDIPDNCVVSGVPAKIIMRDGKKVEQSK